MDHLHFIQPNIESDKTEVQFIIEPDDVIQDILEKKIRLWAYGYIAFMDFRGDEYRSGFCGYLEGYKENRAFSCRFVQDGPEQYISYKDSALSSNARIPAMLPLPDDPVVLNPNLGPDGAQLFRHC